jgi:hypothetical protein
MTEMSKLQVRAERPYRFNLPSEQFAACRQPASGQKCFDVLIHIGIGKRLDKNCGRLRPSVQFLIGRPLLNIAHLDCFSRAGGCAGRLLVFGETVNAQIAFLHFAAFAKLRNSIRARFFAAAAADAFGGVYSHNPVFHAFCDRLNRTYSDARGFGAMQTRLRQRDVDDARRSFLPMDQDLAPLHACFYGVCNLAGDFARGTLHATPQMKPKS